MAKAGLDYFPLDVSMDTKIELIEAEFGLTGFGVVVHLLQEIYGKAGYYIEWTEEVALLFARKVGLGGSVVSEIVEASIRRGMFDRDIYDKYRVLTSRGIQKRYFEAVKRRKDLEVDYNILLVDSALFFKNADIKAKNVNILSKNADILKQSKVEKSKVEYSTVEERDARAKRSAPPTLAEIESYCRENSLKTDPKQFFNYYEAGEWVDAKGNPVRSWKQKLHTWENYEPQGDKQQRREHPNYQPTAEHARENGDWIDKFLSEQEMPGWNSDTNRL